jgi:hypothetical protein
MRRRRTWISLPSRRLLRLRRLPEGDPTVDEEEIALRLERPALRLREKRLRRETDELSAAEYDEHAVEVE